MTKLLILTLLAVSLAQGQAKQYHYALFEDGTICIDYTFCYRHAYHTGKKVVVRGDNNDFEEWWGWGRDGRKLYAQYRLGKLTKEEYQSEIVDEAIVATAEGKTSWSREPRRSKTQERVHRPAQELQDKCVVYRGACIQRHHYVPTIGGQSGFLVPPEGFTRDWYIGGDANKTLHLASKTLTLQDFIALWDEYERECYADSAKHTYDVYRYNGVDYYAEPGIDPGFRPGYVGRREVWEHRDPGVLKDFIDWLKRRKVK